GSADGGDGNVGRHSRSRSGPESGKGGAASAAVPTLPFRGRSAPGGCWFAWPLDPRRRPVMTLVRPAAKRRRAPQAQRELAQAVPGRVPLPAAWAAAAHAWGRGAGADRQGGHQELAAMPRDRSASWFTTDTMSSMTRRASSL